MRARRASHDCEQRVLRDIKSNICFRSPFVCALFSIGCLDLCAGIAYACMQIGVSTQCHHAQLPSPTCHLLVSDRTLVILVDAFNLRLAGNSAYIVALRFVIQTCAQHVGCKSIPPHPEASPQSPTFTSALRRTRKHVSFCLAYSPQF
jgi:hypothetical protein